MADFEENIEKMAGRLEKRQVATESGGDETGDETGGPGDETGDDWWRTRRWRPVGYCMRTKVHIQSTSAMLKRWWGRLEKRRMATESDEDETGGPGDETGEKTAATAGDERDGGDRWVMCTDEGELEFDEDEMAALEGQRLVAEFRCGIY